MYDEDRVYQVGLSIGIATFPNDSSDGSELLMYADTAMFETKDNGRNGFTYYDKSMTANSLNISRVENELKCAIENNELVLYYQPQVDIRTGKVVGVESLVRWNHPKEGLVMPGSFIPIAEDSYLIVELGSWVLREACRQFKEWKEHGLNIEYVAVNVSAQQIQSKHFFLELENLLDELDFNPDWLELEITENTLIKNFESTLKNIHDFKKLGIKFSIDDFGTGYSSFSYLKSLRISTLKIDREFIKDILDDKDDFEIVSAIIAMGHSLNYRIIAEGAEREEEVELLKTINCDVVQGYFFSKPLPNEKLITYVKNNKEW